MYICSVERISHNRPTRTQYTTYLDEQLAVPILNYARVYPIAKQTELSKTSPKRSAQRHTRHMSHKTISMTDDTLKFKTTAISSV